MRGHNVSLETLSDYHAPRRCFREPIAEILNAASLLSEAADAHLAGNKAQADERLRAADMPAVRAWTDSLWGSAKRNPDLPHYIRYRAVPTLRLRCQRLSGSRRACRRPHKES